MAKIKARPGNPGLVVPAVDAIPDRSHKGFEPSTGVSGRGSVVSPQESEGATPRGSNKDSTPKQSGRAKISGPAEHVN